ncbi:hypothetical protein HNQ80_004708 [Anaerosolibacter carboniphilus]|uniref:Leucine Rich repeat-containing protein n=1 Tax=Anaerosolibacter carboniphilus TaxID=1417629 RepID=A0A841KY20_9FIRM|nr:hypothetical protein [Anaerosolibacter carboniphilus]MBB6218534.1 hypothetical protein [Anaerosolibacter carboniphilus]
MEKEEKKDYKKAKRLYLVWGLILIALYLFDVNIPAPLMLLPYWGIYFSQFIFLKRLYKLELLLLVCIIMLFYFSQQIYLPIPFTLISGCYLLLCSIYYGARETTQRKWLQIGAIVMILPLAVTGHSSIRKDHLIKDPVLEKRIKKDLKTGWDEEEITQENLEKLRRLSIASFNDKVYDLEGIQYLKNLESLRIWNIESIKDLNPITSLTKLKRVSIEEGMLRDLAFIKEIHALEELEIAYVNLDGITHIEGPAGLKRVSVLGMDLNDLSLIEELKGIEELRFYDCNIKTMKKIAEFENLKSLEIGNCIIDDLDKTTELESLEAVEIRDSEIPNVEKFRQMPKVKKIIIVKKSSVSP